jgi:hypothetical protein
VFGVQLAAVVQTPFVQAWPPLQKLLHAPQFCGSIWVLVHPGPHCVVPAGQLEPTAMSLMPPPPMSVGGACCTHTEFWQKKPALHTEPQPPQLLLSNAV